MHPHAYRAIVNDDILNDEWFVNFQTDFQPTHTATPSTQFNAKKFSIALVLLVVAILISGHFVGLSSALLQTLKSTLSDWMWISATAASGMIGVGSAAWLGRQVANPETTPVAHAVHLCPRKGPNVTKQAVCQFKREQHRSAPYWQRRQTLRNTPSSVPHRHTRCQLRPEPKFNRIGRHPKQFREPTLHQLRDELHELRCRMNAEMK